MKEIILIDYFRVAPGEELLNLSKSDKHKLLDAALNKPAADDATVAKGITVNMDISHSARRINNRIYTPKGQQTGSKTWTEPFRKPILVNHNLDSEPLGRVKSVTYTDFTNELLKWFKTINDYQNFKTVIDSDNPKKIYKALHTSGLLLDKTWPGLGKLSGALNITDKAAIEKFLDGRYQTFSSGATTDRLVCGVCGSDWAIGDVCEHRPGEITDDGLPVVFITGQYQGREISVVNTPADDLSQVTSIILDSEDFGTVNTKSESFFVNTSDMYITDAVLIGDSIEMLTLNDLLADKDYDIRDLARKIFAGDQEQIKLLADALSGDTLTEQKLLSRIHDSLHGEYDWMVRKQEWNSEDEIKERIDALPRDVFALHGKLHDLADAQGWRDAVVNGPLDGFDSAGSVSTEYVHQSLKATEDIDTPEVPVVEDTVVEAKAPVVEPPVVQDEVLEDCKCTEGCDCQVNDDSIDWYLLDIALSVEVGDAKLSTEARSELKAGQFCGPERSFPVPDCEHVTAARRLVNRSKLSDSQKKKVISCVDRKAKAMKCDKSMEDLEKLIKDLKEELNVLTTDYKNSLDTIKDLRSELENKTQVEDTNTRRSVQDIENVENPANASANVTDSDNNISDFVKRVKTRYETILKDSGSKAAEGYLRNQIRKGYLNKKDLSLIITKE